MGKTCFCCKQTKPIADFYAHQMMADGHLNKCKECVKEAAKARRFDPVSRDRVLAYDRERGSRQEYGYIKEYRSRFPEKYKAHSLVNSAVKCNRMRKEPCQVCGSTERVHAHHDDYSKPLDVRWLCAAHHRQWHAAHGNAKPLDKSLIVSTMSTNS